MYISMKTIVGKPPQTAGHSTDQHTRQTCVDIPNIPMHNVPLTVCLPSLASSLERHNHIVPVVEIHDPHKKVSNDVTHAADHNLHAEKKQMPLVRLNVPMTVSQEPSCTTDNTSFTESRPVSRRGYMLPTVVVHKLSVDNSICGHSTSDIDADTTASTSNYHLSGPRLSSMSNPSSASYLSITDMSSDSTQRRESDISFIMRERLRSLAQNIRRRSSKVKEHIRHAPTPDTVSLLSNDGGEVPQGSDTHSLRSFVADIYPPDTQSMKDAKLTENTKQSLCQRIFKNLRKLSFESQSIAYLAWLSAMLVCFLYNAFAVPFRASYPYQTPNNILYWFLADYFSDLMYLIDMIIFKPRLTFSKSGLTIKDPKEMRKHYLLSWTFKLDLLAILPLDLLYLVPTVGYNSLVRLPRLLKFRCYWNFFYALDSRMKNPYGVRMCKTMGYMFFLIHCNSCIFYSLSSFLGIGSDDWVFDGETNPYIRCFYFTTKLATSIGNNPSPKNVLEFIYVFFSWMMGVFVFAILLGQIQDIVETANRNQDNFRKTMDTTLNYCKKLNLPDPILEKVRMWFTYTWEEQKTLNEMQLLDKLPVKMQTDLAISVHYQTLSKVQLFQNCDKALLRTLVLKLKPVLFLPGDFVCRKGEVGKEMYIVNKGIVQVVGGPNSDQVFVSLNEGSVFGEISLLSLAGGNRRTADVRSKGFSMLFVLSKADLHEAIKDYPDAQKALKRKAKQLVKQANARNQKASTSSVEGKTLEGDELEESCHLSTKLKTPALLKTVVKVIDPHRPMGQRLRQQLHDEEIAKKMGVADFDQESDMNSVIAELPDLAIEQAELGAQSDLQNTIDFEIDDEIDYMDA